MPIIEGIHAAAAAATNGAATAATSGAHPDDRGGGDNAAVRPLTISVDTRRSAVAEAAVAAGAHAVNDVSGGTFDTKMLDTVARTGVPLMMMHMRYGEEG